MRLALAVVFLLVSCTPGHAKAPSWPKAAEKEVDGGESLAPRASASMVAAVEDDGEAEVDETSAAPDKPVATPDAAKPEAAKPATPSQASEEIIITTEDIVIEIDD